MESATWAGRRLRVLSADSPHKAGVKFSFQTLNVPADTQTSSEAIYIAMSDQALHAPEVDWARQAPEVYRYEDAAPELALQGIHSLVPIISVQSPQSDQLQTAAVARAQKRV